MTHFLSFLAALLALMLPGEALAQGAGVLCTFVPGGCPPTNIVQTTAVPLAALLLLRAAAGLGVIFMIWAGYQMLFTFGDDSKVSTARYGILYALIGLGLAAGSQMIVYFVVSEHVEQDISAANWDIQVMALAARVLLNVFNGLFAIILVLAGIMMLIAQGKPEDYNKGKTMAKWAIGGAIIVNIANAAVQAVFSMFGV